MQKPDKVTLIIGNNTESPLPVDLGSDQGASEVNGTTLFQWDITGDDLSTGKVTVDIKQNSDAGFTNYAKDFFPHTQDALLSALNSLKMGIFYVTTHDGHTFINVTSSTMTYGGMVIADVPPSIIPTFTFTTAATNLGTFGLVTSIASPFTVDWGDGTVEVLNTALRFGIYSAQPTHNYTTTAPRTIKVLLADPTQATRLYLGQYNNVNNTTTGFSSLATLTNLNILNLSYLPALATIGALPTALQTLELSNTNFTAIPVWNTGLRNLGMAHATYNGAPMDNTFKVHIPNNLWYLDISWSVMTNLDALPATLTTLLARNCMLAGTFATTLPANLQYLDLSSNNDPASHITAITAGLLPATLTTIYISFLTYLDQATIVNIPDSVQSFNASNGGFTNIPKIPASATSINLFANALPASVVNTVLENVDSAGLHGGSINTAQQIPAAAPTGAGITAKANLVAKGWTVQTD